MYPGTHAATAPERPAVIMAGSGATVTYAELDENSARLASALHAAGAAHRRRHRRADPTMLPEAFEIYWAAIRSGLYVTLRELAPVRGRGGLHRARTAAPRCS